LDRWIAHVLATHNLDGTIDAMTAVDHTAGPGNEERAACARAAITDCDKRLATHRAALEAGADPAVVTAWIAETTAAKARAGTELGRARHRRPSQALSRDEIAALVHTHRDLGAMLGDADPCSKHEIRVEMRLDPDSTPQNRGVSVGVRGGT
jgi:hypothetical protein